MNDLTFSTNHHDPVASSSTLRRHSANLCFPDANLAVLTGSEYFLVHQGLVCRQSIVLQELMKTRTESLKIEGCTVLKLQDNPDDMAAFLIAIYDGVSSLNYGADDFANVSGLLRLSTKYQVRFRADVLRRLSESFPITLAQWDARESKATDNNGVYSPRDIFPQPVLVANLAREINAPELLPSAFYDLSRSPPSNITEGYKLSDDSRVHNLSEEDIMSVLKGREHASRFLSTFMVNELEGREAGDFCHYRSEKEPAKQRLCQVAFETITFELLRDVNGLGNRSSDPLYAILDAELTQGGKGACQSCHAELASAVDRARSDLWRRLPGWFDVEDLEVWGS